MLTRDQLHTYQVRSVDLMNSEPYAMQWVDTGMGKTVSTLTHIVDAFDEAKTYGVLIVAPLRVAQSVWRQEATKWEHTQGLSFSLLHGDVRQREAALARRREVYLINYEGLPWLYEELRGRYLSRGRYLPFDTVIYDEVSKMKGTRTRQGTGRGRAAMGLLPFVRRRAGLTGTPAANGLLDLFGQYLVVDSGQRLGTSFTDYQRKWFYQTDRNGYRWAPFRHTEAEIVEAVQDITISLRADDYLSLPPFIWNDVWLDLSGALQQRYDEVERQMVMELESGHVIDIANAGSLVNRLLQFAGGAVYRDPNDPTRAWERIHDVKLEALDDIIEEAAGKHLLMVYQFRHEAERVIQKYPDTVLVDSRLSEREFHQLIDDWNTGKVTKIITHPDSLGHGVDFLKERCHTMVWFGLNWSLDSFSQMCARLRRQGQKHPVVVHRLLMAGTVDEVQCAALAQKAIDEQSVRALVEDYMRRKR